ncbi:hypothetical protein [uncultured Varibaculum sp.]|uniref:hypothetical protein n=1 Tax=uncultured Varibaculum sp. TaxID=413896 RepID=UPI002889B089|nr:hypothetical protein [uncultured Varibaculum sp.]
MKTAVYYGRDEVALQHIEGGQSVLCQYEALVGNRFKDGGLKTYLPYVAVSASFSSGELEFSWYEGGNGKFSKLDNGLLPEDIIADYRPMKKKNIQTLYLIGAYYNVRVVRTFKGMGEPLAEDQVLDHFSEMEDLAFEQIAGV